MGSKELTTSRDAICQTLMRLAARDRDIVVVTSDSRGSAAMAPFAKAFPEQLVEVGIAEQSLVGVAAGLAAAGKKPYAASYAAFVSMRSIEQIKVDLAYSQTNVKVIGVSGGVSYGPLGMSHHALQDIAVTRAIPNLRVFLPGDAAESAALIETLVTTDYPAYVRIGRNPVPAVYPADRPFVVGEGIQLRPGRDVTLVTTGEMSSVGAACSDLLGSEGISCRVLHMPAIKPLDEASVLAAARETGRLVTLEEHSVHGGLGAAVAEVVVQNHPVPMRILGLPDEPAITGSPTEVLRHYGLDAAGAARATAQFLRA